MDNIFILYHDFSLHFFLKELGLLLVLGGYPIWRVRTIGSG